MIHLIMYSVNARVAGYLMKMSVVSTVKQEVGLNVRASCNVIHIHISVFCKVLLHKQENNK